MASAATLLSPLPNYAHAGIDSAMSTSSPSGLDNLSFDDLVEWNAGNSSSGYFNQQSSSPPSPRATSTSTSTSTYAQPSNNNHPASTSPSIESSDNPPSNANTEALFRHYLSIELRKIGTPVDDSLLDHYVKQHAQGLARASQSSSSSSPLSPTTQRENSPPESDPTASTSSASSYGVASPTFSRRAFSLSPLPENMQTQDQDQEFLNAKAFKISQANDGQFSHFGRSSLGMGIGMSLDQPSFENQNVFNNGDYEMSIDPSLVVKAKEKDENAMSEGEEMIENEGDQTLVDDKSGLAALIVKNLDEDSASAAVSNSKELPSSTASTTTQVERPISSFSSFRPPRVGESPLAPNYFHPSAPTQKKNQNKNDENEDETMITTNAVSNDDPDKPSPEEYKKMSSKEKRQLRNKISARNFRERRKGYIAQLEHELQERDYTIASIRAQMERVNLQNHELKKEVKTLRSATTAVETVAATPKPVACSNASGSAIGASISQADVQRILDALQKTTSTSTNQVQSEASTTPATSSTPRTGLPTLSASSSRPTTPSGSGSLRPISPRPLQHSSSSSNLSTSSSSSIPVPNTRKDAYLSTDGSNPSSFWAGGRSNSMLGGGGFMSVHTTLIPSLSFNPSTNGNSGSEKKGGLTFRGLNNHFRTVKSEKKDFSLPPPAYNDHSFSDKKTSKLEKNQQAVAAAEVGRSFDVYDAFAGLLREGSTSAELPGLTSRPAGEEVPPSYLETISTSQSQVQSQALESEDVEDRVLGALYKAFSSSQSRPADSKRSISAKEDIDLHKLGAFLDGKAELVLVDSQTRREWVLTEERGIVGENGRRMSLVRQ